MYAPEQHHIRLSNLTAMYLPGAPAGFSRPTRLRSITCAVYLTCTSMRVCRSCPTGYFISDFLSPFDLMEVGLDNEALDE